MQTVQMSSRTLRLMHVDQPARRNILWGRNHVENRESSARHSLAHVRGHSRETGTSYLGHARATCQRAGQESPGRHGQAALARLSPERRA